VRSKGHDKATWEAWTASAKETNLPRAQAAEGNNFSDEIKSEQ
jgi:hypothetical protein